MKFWNRWFGEKVDPSPKQGVYVPEIRRHEPVQILPETSDKDTTNHYAVNLPLVLDLIHQIGGSSWVIPIPQKIIKCDNWHHWRSIWWNDDWHSSWTNTNYYPGFERRIQSMMCYVWRTTLQYQCSFVLDVDNKEIVSIPIPPAQGGFFLMENINVSIKESQVACVKIKFNSQEKPTNSVFLGYQTELT